MSSSKELVAAADTPTPNDHVELTDGESVERTEEAEDMAEEDDRKRKSISQVWSHFESIELKEGGKLVMKDQCIHCKKSYKASTARTTSHLLRHLNSCSYMKRLKGEKGFINFDESSSESTPEYNSIGGFDHMECRQLIAKMIVAHELPLSFVEYHWFNELMKYSNPLYRKVSTGTIRKVCIKVVEAEREKLKKVLRNVDMISLSSDCWTSNQTTRYMCLTAHYINSDWKLQKCIISFSELEPPHSGEVISDAILDCLQKWGIQDKIGAITLDNADNNDRAASILMSTFQGRGKLHFEGLFFHVRCCTNMLNLVVQDCLVAIDSCLVKIRDAVKYLKKSSARLLRFGEIAIALGINTGRSLCMDVKTRWNSTHRMLESAVHYKLAFENYSFRDSDFLWSLTNDEWDRAEKVCNLLGVLLDAANLFSSTSYPTINLYLVTIFKVKKAITNAYISDDSFLRKMSKPMFNKFEKYWGDNEVLMSTASVLDPRLKKLSVSWTFEKLYPDDEVISRVKDVIGKLKTLFDKYSNAFEVARSTNTNSTGTSSGAPTSRARQEDDFYAFLKSRPVVNTQRNELEVYLKEPNFLVSKNVEFDVLEWWSQNASKFPVLSKMARDIFCIPITTVDSESAFSPGGPVLDDYRSSLTGDMVEHLVCGADWLKSTSGSKIQTLEASTKEEEDLEITIPTSMEASG